MLLMVAGMHLLGLVCAGVLLIPALRSPEAKPGREDGSDGGWGRRNEPPPKPEKPWGGLPLPNAVPAGVRLRDHHRLPDLLPARERRPAREPERVPERVL